jgi:hypothetical protein
MVSCNCNKTDLILNFLVEIKGKEHGKRNMVSSRLLEMVAEYSGVIWGSVKLIVSGLPFSPRKFT